MKQSKKLPEFLKYFIFILKEWCLRPTIFQIAKIYGQLAVVIV